jgi:amidase
MTPDRAAGLAETARALAEGEVSSRELVERTLARIEDTRGTLNAFRIVRAEAALAEADAADRELAAGARRPLLGVPVAVKDDMDVAGEPTAFGCAGAHPPVAEDGEAVRRLRAAGAVVVGKTNTCELGQWPFTEGPAFGATRNPWHPGHTPGGSSGGSAAAVAAGLVPAALGSDGAGSVRIPAAWTHLVGVKPQRGRVSTGRAARPSTASRSTAPSPARSPTPPCCSTRRAATTRTIRTGRRRSTPARRPAATRAGCAWPSR